jgi:hypothetical protein
MWYEPEVLLTELMKRWKDIPGWLRNITYCALLILFLYRSLCPEYLDGSLLLYKGTTAQKFPEQISVQVYADGRRMAVGLDDNGDWHLPAPTRIPLHTIDMWVVYRGSLYPVPVLYLPIWQRRLDIHAYLEGPEPRFTLDRVTGTRPSDSGWLGNFVTSAMAQTPAGPYIGDSDRAHSINGLKERAEALSALGNRASVSEQAELIADIHEQLGVELTRSAWSLSFQRGTLVNLVENAANPHLSPGFGTEVSRILKSYLPERDLFVGDNIKQSKLQSALASRTTTRPKPTDVLGLLDATVFGSAAVHLLFTSDGMYFRTSALSRQGQREGYIPYVSFPRTTFAPSTFLEVGLGNSQSFDVSGCSIERAKLIDLLNNLKTSVLTIQSG